MRYHTLHVLPTVLPVKGEALVHFVSAVEKARKDMGLDGLDLTTRRDMFDEAEEGNPVYVGSGTFAEVTLAADRFDPEYGEAIIDWDNEPLVRPDEPEEDENAHAVEHYTTALVLLEAADGDVHRAVGTAGALGNCYDVTFYAHVILVLYEAFPYKIQVQ